MATRSRRMFGSGRALRILGWMVCFGVGPLFGCGKPPRPAEGPPPVEMLAPPPLVRPAPIIRTIVRNRGPGPVSVEVVNYIKEG
jgi:hypothetical protein